MITYSDKPEWKSLREHWHKNKDVALKDLFRQDPERHTRYSIDSCGLHLDYSKNLIQDETMDLLEELLDKVDFANCREAMFRGDGINNTEQRSVLHTALRQQNDDPIYVNGENILPLVRSELAKVKSFCDSIQNGEFLGFTGKKIRNVVNIGIGGSDLGPYMVTEALKHYYDDSHPKAYYVSNVDGANLFDVINRLNLEETLFIVASKTFTTQETMTNALGAKKALLQHYNNEEKSVAKHFVAISTNDEEVQKFGIHKDNIFRFWDWVGGRYSLWSTIGLSIALNLGFSIFEELLEGAYEMDQDFLHKPIRKNMPVILALLGVWYNNFYGWESHAILPYSQHLHKFPGFLQQLDMESNGKRVDSRGNAVEWHTGQILWGEAGTNGQHAFFQLIHQGTKKISSDFIACLNPHHPFEGHHNKLLANCLAQSEALMNGRTLAMVERELQEDGLPNSEISRLSPHKVFEGNRPSNTILMKHLTPKTLGGLTALYEHKVFTQGVIWGVNSFDQYGVELGKKLAKSILKELEAGEVNSANRDFVHDSSTTGLLRFCIENRD